MNDKLKKLIDKARYHKMTPAERETQRINFAFGNAKYENEQVTRDGIVRASESLKTAQDHRDPEF